MGAGARFHLVLPMHCKIPGVLRGRDGRRVGPRRLSRPRAGRRAQAGDDGLRPSPPRRGRSTVSFTPRGVRGRWRGAVAPRLGPRQDPGVSPSASLTAWASRSRQITPEAAHLPPGGGTGSPPVRAREEVQDPGGPSRPTQLAPRLQWLFRCLAPRRGPRRRRGDQEEGRVPVLPGAILRDLRPRASRFSKRVVHRCRRSRASSSTEAGGAAARPA